MKRLTTFWLLLACLLLLPTAAFAQAPDSSESGRLVFQQATGGPIFTVNLDGTGLTQVGVGIDPSWSPDGTQIVYARWHQPWGIYMVNADGSNEQRVFDLQTTRSPRISPDGQTIVFTQRNWDVGEHEQCITFSAYGFSKTFCYDAPPDDNWTLKLLNLNDKRLSDLPAWPHVKNPVWHPDNQQIIYANEKGIHRMDREGTFAFDVHLPYRHAVTLETSDTDPAISPDGRYMVTTYHQHDHWEIHRVDLLTGERRRLTKSTLLDERDANNVSPTWSPDGQSILFLSDRDGGEGVWNFYLMNTDGSNQHPILQEITNQYPLRYDFQGEQVVDWTK